MPTELLPGGEGMVFALAVVIGVLAAIVNMVAGGGSALSLGLLLASGMPPQVANGTNRLVILVQSVTGAVALGRRRRIPVRAALGALPAAAVGTVLGAWSASVMDEGVFRMALAWVFVAMGVVLVFELWRGRRGGGSAPVCRGEAVLRWWMHPALLAAGFMAGFVQMGVGILVLLVLHVLGRMEIVASNAIKIVLAVMFSVVSLTVFVLAGQVDWRAGLGLALGGWLGAVLGIRLMLRLPANVVRGALVVFVLLAAWRLFAAG